MKNTSSKQPITWVQVAIIASVDVIIFNVKWIIIKWWKDVAINLTTNAPLIHD